MRFSETKIAGVVLIELEPHEDQRGFFARTFCRREFRANGLMDHIEQSSISFNRQRGTLRGMHFQAAPHEEMKLVSCIQGRVFDVALDVRPQSPTHGQWFGVELSAENRRMLYLPAGIAHGFQTLDDASAVFYQISEAFHPESARGIRWNDSRVGVLWPIPDDPIISERDRAWPDWRPNSLAGAQ
jgi:dTDP-4-dehydrorhamnose 3,5-epimerase